MFLLAGVKDLEFVSASLKKPRKAQFLAIVDQEVETLHWIQLDFGTKEALLTPHLLPGGRAHRSAFGRSQNIHVDKSAEVVLFKTVVILHRNSRKPRGI